MELRWLSAIPVSGAAKAKHCFSTTCCANFTPGACRECTLSLDTGFYLLHNEERLETGAFSAMQWAQCATEFAEIVVPPVEAGPVLKNMQIKVINESRDGSVRVKFKILSPDMSPTYLEEC